MVITEAGPKTRYDYAKLPDSPRQQLIQGHFVEEPGATYFHQRAIGNLYYLIRLYLKEHPIGEVFLSPLDAYISETNVYQPDVFFIRNENRRKVKAHGIEGAPDLAIEVLSPSTAKYDLGAKRQVYGQSGVEELWIVDTKAGSVAIYRLQLDRATPTAIHTGHSSFSSLVLPGLSLSLADIFE